MKRLVLLGGGHAHVKVLAELAEQPWAGCVLQMRVDVPGLPVHFAIE